MGDYLHECNNGKLRVDAVSFQETWCVRCSRQGCALAAFARTDPMAHRQATWRERYFGNNEADLNVPEYARIAAIDFPNLFRKAIKMEISRKRGDWSVPEISISDGRLVTASSETTDHVDEAVRQLRTGNSEELPSASEEYDATLGHDLHWEESDPPAQEIEEEPEDEGPIAPPVQPDIPPSRAVIKARPRTANTPDRGDVMIGGDSAPSERAQPPVNSSPWAPPPKSKYKIVEAGATIVLGNKGD